MNLKDQQMIHLITTLEQLSIFLKKCFGKMGAKDLL